MRRERREARKRAEGEVRTVGSRDWEESGDGREGRVLAVDVKEEVDANGDGVTGRFVAKMLPAAPAPAAVPS
jgi:hypothetical protein